MVVLLVRLPESKLTKLGQGVKGPAENTFSSVPSFWRTMPHRKSAKRSRRSRRSRKSVDASHWAMFKNPQSSKVILPANFNEIMTTSGSGTFYNPLTLSYCIDNCDQFNSYSVCFGSLRVLSARFKWVPMYGPSQPNGNGFKFMNSFDLTPSTYPSSPAGCLSIFQPRISELGKVDPPIYWRARTPNAKLDYTWSNYSSLQGGFFIGVYGATTLTNVGYAIVDMVLECWRN